MTEEIRTIYLSISVLGMDARINSPGAYAFLVGSQWQTRTLFGREKIEQSFTPPGQASQEYQSRAIFLFFLLQHSSVVWLPNYRLGLVLTYFCFSYAEQED